MFSKHQLNFLEIFTVPFESFKNTIFGKKIKHLFSNSCIKLFKSDY